MLVHPQFDPVALQLGPLAIHWYGLMYLVAFVQVILLGRWCIAHRPWTGWDAKMLDDVLFYGVLGVILGGGSATCCSTSPATISPTRSTSSRYGKAA